MRQHRIGLEYWRAQSLNFQMANVGSEVARAIKWRQNGNNGREISQAAFWRALELLSLTKAAHRHEAARLKEICRLYEVLVDYFNGKNIYRSSAATMKGYFDFFARRTARERRRS